MHVAWDLVSVYKWLYKIRSIRSNDNYTYLYHIWAETIYYIPALKEESNTPHTRTALKRSKQISCVMSRSLDLVALK